MFYPARLVRLERFVLKETRIELPPTWRFYPARLVRLERFVLKETRIEWPPTWRFYSARLVRFERFVLKETRIELPPTWRFYPARLVRFERLVFKETTHTAVPHVDLLSRATWVVTISGGLLRWIFNCKLLFQWEQTPHSRHNLRASKVRYIS